MVYKKILYGWKRMSAVTIPKHPHYSRSKMLEDGTFISANSYDDVEGFDDVPCTIEAVSITDVIQGGGKLEKMASPQHNTTLFDAEFAEGFVSAFNAAAGYSDDASSSSESSPSGPSPSPTNSND